MQPIDLKGPSPLLLTPLTNAALTRSWTVGQILTATVMTPTTDNGTVQLRIGANTLEARTALPVRPGDSLQLKVESAGQPVVLRVLTPAAAEQAVWQQALRAVLPRQGEIAPLLAQLARFARASSANTPAPLPVLTQRILDSLPEARDLGAGGQLKSSLQRSGAFLESTLGREGAPPPQDFKAALLQLRSVLPAPAAAPNPVTVSAPESATGPLASMARDVEAALARIEYNQLTSAPVEQRPVSPLVIELPVREGGRTDVLRLQVESDEERSANGEPLQHTWTVWLSFSPGDLGRVHCRLTVSGERVSADFWAEHESTARLLRHHLSDLDAGLRRAELTPSHLGCQAGEPPRDSRTLSNARLLDERA